MVELLSKANKQKLLVWTILIKLLNYKRKHNKHIVRRERFYVPVCFVTLVWSIVVLALVQIIFKILQWMSLHYNDHGALVQSFMAPRLQKV